MPVLISLPVLVRHGSLTSVMRMQSCSKPSGVPCFFASSIIFVASGAYAKPFILALALPPLKYPISPRPGSYELSRRPFTTLNLFENLKSFQIQTKSYSEQYIRSYNMDHDR